MSAFAAMPTAWLAPALAAAAALVLALAVGAGVLRERSADLAVLAFAVVAAASIVAMDAPATWIVDRVLVADPFATFFQFVLALVATAIVWLGPGGGDDESARGCSAVAVAAIAASLLGLQILVAATGWWTLWAGFELSGLAMAVAAACAGAAPRREAAAALLRGGLASALLLAGFALVAGLTGAGDHASLAERIALASSTPGGRAACATALVLVGAGLSVRVTVVAWASWPVGHAAALPLATGAWVFTGGSLAALAALARLSAGVAWAPGPAGAASWSALLALATVCVGTAGMLRASELRRLFAWIAVAQSGYLLLGLATVSPRGLEAMLFQSAVHAVTLVGLAAACQTLPPAEGRDGLAPIRGLARRGREGAAGAAVLLVFLLSFAGAPPLAGYAGRVRLFAAALDDGSWLRAAALLAASAVGGLGALRVVALLFDRSGAPVVDGGAVRGAERDGTVPSARVEALALAALLAAATLAIGMAPGPLAAFAARSVVFFGG